MSSSYLLISRLNIDDLNMDGIKFGLLNTIPYGNTKLMLAVLTKELAKQKGVNAYALCPGIVNTHIYDNAPLLLKLVKFVSLTFFSTSPSEVISISRVRS